jgi:hypothetical protein
MDEPPVDSDRQADESRAEQKNRNIFGKFVCGLKWFVRMLDRHDGLVTAFGTLVIAVFTVVLALATIELKRLGEKQSSDMESSVAATRDAAIATSKAADAAVEANELARQANRPWLGAVSVVVVPSVTSGKPVTVTLNVTNAGKTAARIDSLVCASQIANGPPAEGTELTLDAARLVAASRSIVVPGQAVSCPFKVEALKPDEIGRIGLSYGSYGFYVLGLVHYTDLTTSASYRTEICYIFRPNVDAYASCPKYNTAN